MDWPTKLAATATILVVPLGMTTAATPSARADLIAYGRRRCLVVQLPLQSLQ